MASIMVSAGEDRGQGLDDIRHIIVAPLGDTYLIMVCNVTRYVRDVTISNVRVMGQ